MAQQITISAVAIAALILIPMLLTTGGAAVAGDDDNDDLMPSCVRSCGGVEVPYPFGIGTDASCYLPGFNLTCDNTTGGGEERPRLLLDAADSTLQVVWIDAELPLLHAQRSGDAKIDIDADGRGTFSGGLRHDGPYTLYPGNELILTGCNVQVTVKNGNGVTMASCTSLCRNRGQEEDTEEDDDGDVTAQCSSASTGCCQANIVTPDYEDDDDGSSSAGTTSGGYDVQLGWLGSNSSEDLQRHPVRVFVAWHGWFDNSSIYTNLLQADHRPPSTKEETMAAPVWLTWDVLGHPSSSHLCKSSHSERENGTRRGSYTCRCSQGYHGNPYLTHGCKDDNECALSPARIRCYGECTNTAGSFTCRCPQGTTGNHSIPGGCVDDTILAATGSCMTSCGDVEVPYPFGVGSSKCYWPGFELVCDTTHDPPRLLLGKGHYQVVSICLSNTTVRVTRTIDLDEANSLFTAHGVTQTLGQFSSYFDEEAPYSLSTGNELILTGCNTQATLLGHGNPSIISGCASFCSHNDTGAFHGRWPTSGIHGGNGRGKYCYGMGCCQAQVAESMDGMPKELLFKWLDTNEPHYLIPMPGYVVIAEEGWFDQPDIAGKVMREGEDGELPKKIEIPLLLRWEVLLLQNGSSSPNMGWHPDCDGDQVARNLCKSKQSHCQPGNRGYSCQCNDSYHGNPYLLDGCQGGTAKSFKGISIIIGVASGAGLILLVVIAYFISYKFKHQRAQMLRRRYFDQNRGQLLQQLVSQRADIAEKMIITLDELAKATNNFDKARELGRGGHGTVYKGILSDLHVVAIKKPKMVIQREIDEFINEVAILSQINHRNVVTLYGCCLETEVPMLVYEFISNGTLYDHLHVEAPISLSWDDRLRIAIETAKALAYLHSTALIPIIHRDVKPANILLDDTLTAKVADFGASRYIPLDKSGLSTKVQGTLGYLDPMYLHTRRLTEKSDVYSFGVMLIELMTRKKPFTYMSSEGNGLVAHFVTLFAEGNLLHILDPQLMKEGGNKTEEIAGIAVACVNFRGEERPTMRQVELRLEAAQSSEEFELNSDIATKSLLSRDGRSKEESASRQYSMEEEYMLSARYPR